MATTQKKPQSSLLKPLGAFFRRFHLILFFILIAGLVSAAIYLINQALSGPADEAYTSSINAGTIDRATLDRVQSLHSRNEPATVQLPAGRVNPFAE